MATPLPARGGRFLRARFVHACSASGLALALACLWLQTARAAPASLPDGLSLAEARRIAGAQNPGLAAARQRVRAAVAAVRAAKSQRWPSLDLTASAERYQDLPNSSGGQFVQTPYEVYRLEARLNWLLYSGERVSSEVAGAKAAARASETSLNDAGRLLGQAVATAFFQALLARENLQVAERDAAFNDSLQEEAQKRRQAGSAGREELLNFSLRSLLARSEAIRARRELKTARIALAELLDLEPAALPDRVRLTPQKNPPAAAPELQSELDFAWQRRPDLRAAQHRLDQGKAALGSARSDSFPQVSSYASAAQTHTESSGFADGRDKEIVLGISLAWNAFDAGKTDADSEAAAAAVAQARHELAGRRTEVAAAVRQQHERLQAALEQLELAREALDLTREIRGIVTQQYQGGQVSITRLNEVQTDLVRAESHYAAAQMRARLARQDLNAETGRISLGVDGETP